MKIINVIFYVKIGIYIKQFILRQLHLKLCAVLVISVIIFNQCEAQDLDNVLLTNFDTKNKVVELSIINTYDSFQFTIATYDSKTKVLSSEKYFARSGKHYYEMRHLEGWNGKVDFLVTDIPKAAIRSIKLVNPNISQSVDLFLDKKPLTPGTVNFCSPIRLFSLPFNYFLLGLASFIFLLVFYIKKVNLFFALSISCFSMFMLNDTRHIIEHWQIFKIAEENGSMSVPAVAFPQQFIDLAKPIIGNSAWTIKGKLDDETHKIFIKYRLANAAFVRRPKPGTYVITREDNSHEKKKYTF